MINGNIVLDICRCFMTICTVLFIDVVIDDQENGRVMEVRRLLYRRRDWERHVW